MFYSTSNDSFFFGQADSPAQYFLHCQNLGNIHWVKKKQFMLGFESVMSSYIIVWEINHL